MIKRDLYLNRLISKRKNGLVKIITGLRRCGKSYLLFNIFKDYLNSAGVDDDHIIRIALDKIAFDELRNPENLYNYILSRINDKEEFAIFIDEIQLSYKIKKNIDASKVADDDQSLLYTTFYDVLNDLMDRKNLDIYVTGSNSRTLSKDVATNFRGRGSEIRLFPLSFSEYYEYCGLEKSDAWEEYMTFGGMPPVVLEENETEKTKYLKDLFSHIYMRDIKERYNLSNESLISELTDVIFSSSGSLTNPHKLANTMNSLNKSKISDHTVKNYLEHLEDSFIIQKAMRYDIKGKSYLDYPSKYYAADIGLRNARLNFRQQEKTHIMENIIYNELVSRGYSVDVGIIEVSKTENGVQKRTKQEIDFIVNRGFNKTYIQSAFNIENEDKHSSEIRPLLSCGDFFKKIVVLNGNQKKTLGENGIVYIGVIPFLLDKESAE